MIQKGGVAMEKEVLEKSVIPYYGAGLCWLFYSLIFPMYRLRDFLLASAFSIILFFILGKLFPGKKVMVSAIEQLKPTGNPQADQMISEGRQVLLEIGKIKKKIKKAEILGQISRIEEISGQIFSFISQNPEDVGQLRKFLNYYLPTVLKLLNSYERLSNESVRGSNIASSLQHIEEILGTVVVAFEKQLDNLYQAEALDISTDITVLEGMLAQEGLTEKK